MTNRLGDLFNALQQRLSADLMANRRAITHPSAKGDASEANWLDMLNLHLPNRYKANKSFVIDSTGTSSEQLDVVIYDPQYTPILYNRDDQKFLPAESVYAVFEVKQVINKPNIEYAGQKLASVRALHRTSTSITHAGGQFEPREPFPILGGILACESDWSSPLGESLHTSLRDRPIEERLDLGCVVASGAFEPKYDTKKLLNVEISTPENSLVYFFIRLLTRLQLLGTVPAIDYEAYARTLNLFGD